MHNNGLPTFRNFVQSHMTQRHGKSKKQKEVSMFRFLNIGMVFYCEIVELKDKQNSEWEAKQVCVRVSKMKERLSLEAVPTLRLDQ